MKNLLSSEEIESILEYLEPEGQPFLYLGGELEVESVPNIPISWIEIFKNPATKVEKILEYWSNYQNLLPQTCKLLRDKLFDLALIISRGEPPSLLYVLRCENELFGQRGFIPATDDELILAKPSFRSLIQEFYKFHNGWIDLFSADGGPLPIAKWQKIEANEITASAELLGVFTNGSHMIGIESNHKGVMVHRIWPNDDEVETINNFWMAIDDELALSLDDCDESHA
jgi:hypothetical protein